MRDYEGTYEIYPNDEYCGCGDELTKERPVCPDCYPDTADQYEALKELTELSEELGLYDDEDS